jgi:Uncharacterised nucleotidyltransferase
MGEHAIVSVDEPEPETAAAAQPSRWDGELWRSVERLIDTAPDFASLEAHGLLLLGVRRWRETGREIPAEHAQIDKAAAFVGLGASALVARIRKAYDGRIMLVKGPAVAERYPGRGRAYGDVDLMVDDAADLQRLLIADGFYEVDEPELFEDIHHLRPLAIDGIPLLVELHSRPKWPERMTAPSAEELFAAGRPTTAVAVEGVLEPSDAHHAMLLAAHGWGHGALRSVRDLIDVAVMRGDVDPRELEHLARRWGMLRLWRTTNAAIESLLDGTRRPPVAVQVFGRHLAAARERTVLEAHLERWLSPFWALSPSAAAAESFGTIKHELSPAGNETWGEKLTRTRQAIRRAFVARSRHEQELGDLATRGDLRRIIDERRRSDTDG